MQLKPYKSIVLSKKRWIVIAGGVILSLLVYFYFSCSNKQNTSIIKHEAVEPKTAITFKGNAQPSSISKQSDTRRDFENLPANKSLAERVDEYLPPNYRNKNEKESDKDSKKESGLETLYSATDSVEQELVDISAPFGRLLACETVLTIDSSNTETPIIALVTEDLWYDGKLIVQAGTEVHGSARAVKNRDRVVTDNDWKLVWVTKDEKNGLTLPLKAIALNKDKNDVETTWSLVDGAAGIHGTLLKADELIEMKLFGATFLGGAIAAIQQPSSNPSSSTENSNPVKTSVAMASAQGVAAVIERYAETIMESIEKEGFFIRIPAGKQFYLYIQQPIDLTLAQKMK